jgi:transcriptional regulator with XRE-family HTH domain
MADLETQLTGRVKTFLHRTGLSQRQLSKLIGCDPGNFNAFLGGFKTLSNEKLSKLLQVLNANRKDLEMKLSRPATAQVTHLQIDGLNVRLDNGGWIAKEGDSAADPNNQGGDITNTWKANGAPSDDDLIDTLRAVDNFHKQAREAIAQWFANYQKAKPNSGPTEGPRRINDNAVSRTPGPRGDRFSRR